MKQLSAFAACASVCISVTAIAQQARDAETDLWNAIDPKQPCEYRAYLEDYPKGKYASLASLRLTNCPSAARPAAIKDAGSAAHEPLLPASPGAAEGAARESEPTKDDTPVARLESLVRHRKIFNCSADSQSITVSAGILSYSGCSFDGTRVNGSAVLSDLAVARASVNALTDELIRREPALKDYVVLSIPCARGRCYSIQVTFSGGERTLADQMTSMAFYVPRSRSEECLALVKALATHADPG